MNSFLTSAPYNASTGSPAYAQSVLDFYYQNLMSGMIEINLPAGQLLLLIAEGIPVSAYRTGAAAGPHQPLPPDRLFDSWPAGDAHIRSLALPRQAVRLARQVFEWQPPLSTWDQPTLEIPAFLDSFRTRIDSGLLHIVWERSEGYLTLQSGEVVLNESVLSSPHQVTVGEANYRRILFAKDPICRISCCTSRQDSPAGEQQLLRLALTGWASHILQRYQQLVGRSLIGALTGELNGCLHARPLYIQLAADGLQDTHVFGSTEHCVQAYQLVITAMAHHMGKVIGSGLTRTVFKESFSKLRPTEQHVLTRHALLPAFSPPQPLPVA
jgi:hypothetical protein